MHSYKYLIKNMFLLTLSSFTTKLLSFFLVPLYTFVLSAEEYGTYDLFNTTIMLLVPILTFNILESALRFPLDKKYDNQDIFSVAIKYLLISYGIFTTFIIMNLHFNIVPILNDYWIFILLMFYVNSFLGILSAFSRGIDKIREISISSVLASFITIILNIVFLLNFKLGLVGYFLANILGPFTQIIYLFIRIKAWNYIKISHENKNLQKEMLTYSKPLIANSVAWWVNNSSDRYIITWFCGLASNGIYSVAYKIPSILNILQGIFNQAWTLSAVKDFDSEDKDGFFSNSYNIYNFLMVISCSLLILLNQFLAKILYAKDFFQAWQYVPFLLIAIVFGALSGYLGGIFSAVKNSKIFAQSTVIGALLNITLNIIFVLQIGPLGAAISTAISYWIVWILRLYHARRYIDLKLNLLRDYIAYTCLLIQAIVLLFTKYNIVICYLIEFLVMLIILILFTKEMSTGYKRIKIKLRRIRC